MAKRNIIVIGASAGGFHALRRLVADLPANLDASIFVVWHISPDVRGILPTVLNNLKGMPVSHAEDNAPVLSGRIFVAPPDHHLVLEQNSMRLSRGPKENRFRPAIDPLFRSAAITYGPRVIGVILSGALDDGTVGLWTIKEFGGTAIVQDPDDADVPSMPQSALDAVDVDYKIPVSGLGALLAQLVEENVPEHPLTPPKGKAEASAEVQVAMENETHSEELYDGGELTRYTCPECQGVLASFKKEGILRFRCHTGHAFTADSLLATVSESIEDTLWGAVRTIRESVFLLNHMGDHFAEINQPKLAALYFQKANEAEGRARHIRQAVLEHEHLTTAGIRHQIGKNAGNGMPTQDTSLPEFRPGRP